ncbi:hypothetical protein HY490_00925 [Candidatus Woesearchaeota archaeon]|nr:hypothetical protein [Candidatus Woesearchaeota archaeon]
MRAEKCSHHKEPLISIVLDTLQKNKQALVFVNTKRSAEKAAEDISKTVKHEHTSLNKLAEQVLGALGKATHQCERLAKCIQRGIAFHHAGLHSKQKELVEDAFRDGTIKIICCTPTLAAGLDLPAFRAIIRDVKRYGDHGMTDIPVLEYLQMSGRAGRPRFDTYGESIIVTNNDSEKDRVWDKYVHGEPEDIYSKLAVEPVLRTYVLSLIATKVVKNFKELIGFFEKTFWAYQYHDMHGLEQKIHKVVSMLEKWEFTFIEENSIRATPVGQRVAQLYIDPLTAHHIITCVQRATSSTVKPLSWLLMACRALEMRPLLKIKTKEYDIIQEHLATHQPYVLENEPSMFEIDYEDYLNAFKTSLLLYEWIDEKDEEYLLEHYDCRPGETRHKIETADWLLYAAQELCKLLQFTPVIKDISRVRFRLKYGVKEELLALLRLREVGRVRARKLFAAGIKTLGDVRQAETTTLARIVGVQIANKIKQQVGQDTIGEMHEDLPYKLPDRQTRLAE